MRKHQIPYDVIKTGSSLLHQQCWVWGQDIKCPTGNLLLDYGFQCQRPPENLKASSQYTIMVDDALYVRLWGFGLYYGGEQGIFLNRYSFVPRCAFLCACWQGKEMQGLPRERDLRLMPGLLRWIAVYEEWIKNRTSAKYQLQRVANFKTRRSIGQQSATTWLNMADKIERLLDNV